MTAVLVDTNVILDVTTEDETWFEWSSDRLARHAGQSRLVINPIVYAEVSVGFERIETLDAALPEAYFDRESLPWEAGFLAGKAFLDYRRRSGSRETPLPDFYIGAHAAVREYRLLTRDRSRYETYFPTVEVIAPE